MLKKISTAALRKGMFVDQFCGSWLDHPFWSRKLLIEDDKTLETIVHSSIAEVVIDTAKGADVAPNPTSNAAPDLDPETDSDEFHISVIPYPSSGHPTTGPGVNWRGPIASFTTCLTSPT